jgi:predicted nuclease with TOPRIM domain
LDSIIEDVERNQQIFGWFSRSIGALARITGRLNETMVERFEQVDQRFEQVDQRFEQVDQRFDKVDLELGLVNDSIRKLDARMETLVAYIIRDERKVE